MSCGLPAAHLARLEAGKLACAGKDPRLKKRRRVSALSQPSGGDREQEAPPGFNIIPSKKKGGSSRLIVKKRNYYELCDINNYLCEYEMRYEPAVGGDL